MQTNLEKSRNAILNKEEAPFLHKRHKRIKTEQINTLIKKTSRNGRTEKTKNYYQNLGNNQDLLARDRKSNQTNYQTEYTKPRTKKKGSISSSHRKGRHLQQILGPQQQSEMLLKVTNPAKHTRYSRRTR